MLRCVKVMNVGGRLGYAKQELLMDSSEAKNLCWLSNFLPRVICWVKVLVERWDRKFGGCLTFSYRLFPVGDCECS